LLILKPNIISLAWLHGQHKKTEITGSVLTQISSQHSKLVAMNRSYNKTLIDILPLLLSRQGISFRGHDETANSLNQGV